MKQFYLMSGFLIILLFNFNPSRAQVMQPAGKLDVNFRAGGQVAEISSPVKVISNYYLLDEWQIGNVYLYDGKELDNLMLKYDIEKERLELNTTVGLRTIQGNLVKFFEVYELKGSYSKKRIFTNISNFKHNLPLPRTSFFELVNEEGNNKLMVRHSITVKDSYYVPALDAGSKDPQVFKAQELYLWMEGELIPVGKKKKEIYSFFGEFKKEVEDYAENNKLNPRKKLDLLRLVEKYNELKGV